MEEKKKKDLEKKAKKLEQDELKRKKKEELAEKKKLKAEYSLNVTSIDLEDLKDDECDADSI